MCKNSWPWSMWIFFLHMFRQTFLASLSHSLLLLIVQKISALTHSTVSNHLIKIQKRVHVGRYRNTPKFSKHSWWTANQLMRIIIVSCDSKSMDKVRVFWWGFFFVCEASFSQLQRDLINVTLKRSLKAKFWRHLDLTFVKKKSAQQSIRVSQKVFFFVFLIVYRSLQRKIRHLEQQSARKYYF